MVPITSIVHRDEETLIYIERAPGMLDGVQVKIGNRIDDYYEIVEGEIQVGQHVVVMGTLLVDAESRLNPNLSTQYFGASDKRVSDTAPTAKRKSVHIEGERVLNPKDRAIVEEQRYCPVTRATLGSMGAPVFVTVDQRRVAICCEGCQSQLEKEPSKYLGWLDEKLAGERKPK